MKRVIGIVKTAWSTVIKSLLGKHAEGIRRMIVSARRNSFSEWSNFSGWNKQKYRLTS